VSYAAAKVNPDDKRRYAWPGADRVAVEAACGRIARRLALAEARIVGLLPIGRTGALAPLLVRVAAALTRFYGREVAVIERWTTWPPADAPGWGTDEAGLRFRLVRPNVVAIAPLPCVDSPSAALALQAALAALPKELAAVLVDLGEYPGDGRLPAALMLVDAVVPVLRARRTRTSRVAEIVAELPGYKSVGSILVG
jgi:hypothetical protein